jgi:hypothetical protein
MKSPDPVDVGQCSRGLPAGTPFYRSANPVKCSTTTIKQAAMIETASWIIMRFGGIIVDVFFFGDQKTIPKTLEKNSCGYLVNKARIVGRCVRTVYTL